MAFIGNNPTDVPLTGSQIANGTIVNANVATNTLNLTQKVTSTLPFANGGTGLSALGTAGQALVVNSGASALEYATVGAQAGQVIQVLTATDSTTRTTTSTSFVTGSNTLSVTITPSSASNKIFIIASLGCLQGDAAISTTIYRASTNLGGTRGFFIGDVVNATMGFTMSYLDSPATTSATTYQVYFRSTSGTNGIYGSGNLTSTITCFEIKG